MTSQGPILERTKTDESLRNERTNADDAMLEKESTEQAADKLVDRARSRADAVLDQARDRADQDAGTEGSAVQMPKPAIQTERAHADSLLVQERASEDENLRRERQEQTDIQESQLVMERAKTDRYLLSERGRSDDALAHRDDFLGMVSHDLRNLLNNVNLNAIYLGGKASGTEEGQRTIEGMRRIRAAVAHMDSIIKDLIDVVSIDAGKLAINPTQGNAAVLLTEAVEAFAIAAAQKDISLSAQASEQALSAYFDHQRMSQVLANCLSNAIKFTPRGGRIELRGASIGDDIRLSVSDTGPGIPMALQNAVFERFWQVGANDQRGLGLGLYISRCIVTGHHGKIWFDVGTGGGSTIHCSIPRRQSAAP